RLCRTPARLSALTVCTGLFLPAVGFTRCFLTAPSIGSRRSIAVSSVAMAAAASAAPSLGPLLDSEGKEVDGSSLEGKSVALYFAGEWCPMCTAFTPVLTEFMKDVGDKAVVFVSSDFTKEEYDQHRSHLPSQFLSVPFGSEMQDSLKRKFHLWGGREIPKYGGDRRGGIPALVVITPGGEEQKYLDAESKGGAALKEW
ncbi:unnamed protein product, partial [Symbiodinium sp. CCMP2456]